MSAATEALAASAGGRARPKDENSQNLSRWSKRWSDNFIGWHQDDVHRVLLEHGGHMSLPPSRGDNSCLSGREGAKCDPAGGASEGVDSGRRIFVPLCGKSVDMAYLAKLDGVEVVGIEGVAKALDDFAQENPDLEVGPPRTAGDGVPFERRDGKSISLLRGDYFDLAPSATGGPFDAVWDRAALVAVAPALRERYVSVTGSLVKRGGIVLLLAFERREGTDEARGGGPPYSVDEGEVRRLFGGAEWVESVTKVAEYDEMEDEAARERWSSKGLTAAYELLFVIKAKR